MTLTYAFCTFNRADRLDALVAAMRAQKCPIPFEILAVNNNSTDGTAAVLERLSALPGPPLRVVTESVQGIVAARNRAVEESLNSDIMVFIDDDELPLPGTLTGAVAAVVDEGAQCAGGRVQVDFSEHRRPSWLGDELLGFLAAVDYGETPFWITDLETPVWTANVAYDMRLFRDDPDLRFDQRYDRVGKGVGGGEDVLMFRALIARRIPMRYRPDMCVLHDIEPWRLRRSYFLKLHYQSGYRYGLHELPAYGRTFLGMPPFLASQLGKKSFQALSMYALRRRGSLRQMMNAAHALGSIRGYLARGERRGN